VGIRCADHVTPLYPQKLALTSPTGGGRSVGIVRSRTKATEFSFSLGIKLPEYNASSFEQINPHSSSTAESVKVDSAEFPAYQ
jgi:hypothetical protein